MNAIAEHMHFMVWHGNETVFDPGVIVARRREAFEACDRLAAEGADATAFVVHWQSGDWAVFINPS